MLLVVLAGAVAFNFLPRRVSERFSPSAPLAEMFPASIDGWQAVDMPLGATERESGAVQGILRSSDFVFRIYRKGDREIGLYVSYWRHGASSIVSAGGHSPDVCWVQSGWDRVGTEDEVTFEVDGFQSLPAQIRSFTNEAGGKRHVVFWHVMDGCRTGYALGDSANWLKRAPVIFDAMVRSRFGLLRAGQYFIRIDSNRPIAEIQREGVFIHLLRSSAACGIFGREPLARPDRPGVINL